MELLQLKSTIIEALREAGFVNVDEIQGEDNVVALEDDDGRPWFIELQEG